MGWQTACPERTDPDKRCSLHSSVWIESALEIVFCAATFLFKEEALECVAALPGFDVSFQPSLDRNRILTLAQLEFIDRHEVLHLLGPPPSGRSTQKAYPLVQVGLSWSPVLADGTSPDCGHRTQEGSSPPLYNPPAVVLTTPAT